MSIKKLWVLDKVLEGLMAKYTERVPAVQKVITAMVAEGIISDATEIENDHIAFRTLGLPQLGIQSLEKIFLYYGYTKKDHYYFSQKKLDAFWYAPPQPYYPRIFISELRVKDLALHVQDIIYRYTGKISTDPVDRLALDDENAVDAFLHSSLWPLPTFREYQTLAATSEYAAWVMYNRYYLNHFTISVHQLPEGFNTIDNFCAFLQGHGIILNDAGGIIKTSPDGLLVQAATVAAMINAPFADGVHPIPGSYVEFAERKLLPGTTLRREGFEAANADKIFESTYTTQTKRTIA